MIRRFYVRHVRGHVRVSRMNLIHLFYITHLNNNLGYLSLYLTITDRIVENLYFSEELLNIDTHLECGYYFIESRRYSKLYSPTFWNLPSFLSSSRSIEVGIYLNMMACFGLMPSSTHYLLLCYLSTPSVPVVDLDGILNKRDYS